MATREEKIAHAKQERLCGIVCWMNGGPRGHELDPRWSGDDGRIVENPEIMWMRLLLLEEVWIQTQQQNIKLLLMQSKLSGKD